MLRGHFRAVLLLVAVTAVPSLAQSQSTVTGGSGQVGVGDKEKLIAITNRTSDHTVPELSLVLQVTLESQDAAIRERALNAISARVSEGDRGIADRDSELRALTALKPNVFTKLSDSEWRVRRAAVMAIGNIELAMAKDKHLDAATIIAFARHFHAEQSVEVRAEIAKGFALVANAGPEVTELLEAAIDDSEPSRVFRRANSLRGLAHGKTEKIRT